MFNTVFEQTLFCAITLAQSATKMSAFFVWNFIIKMKLGFSVLLARYGPMKNVLGNNFSANLKEMCFEFRC